MSFSKQDVVFTAIAPLWAWIYLHGLKRYSPANLLSISVRFRLVFSVALLLCGASIGFAQDYAKHWYFGSYDGLDFTGGSPVYDPTNTGLFTEGTVSISDEQGNLQFYYGGDSVITAQHTQMVNGDKIGGPDNGTATQFFATAQPDSAHRYHVLTPSIEFSTLSRKLYYSIIDMNKQGGLGEVVLKDSVLIDSRMSEMVHGVKHHNGEDVWIAAIKSPPNFSGDTLMRYLLTNSGLSAPVKTPLNRIFLEEGLAKFSSGGDFLVVGPLKLSLQRYVLYQFDKVTGTVSNPIVIDLGPGSTIAGGLEFSCDGLKLYISSGPSLFQYDLTTYDSTSIANSRALIGSDFYGFGYMQLGPDRKIYVLRSAFANSMGVIDQPMLGGLAANYSTNGPAFPPNSMNPWSLPAFEPTCLCLPFIQYEDTCFNDSTAFELMLAYQVDSVFWDFGDPNSGLANQDTGVFPTHVFSDTGTYTVQAVYHRFGLVDTAYVTVHILELPTLDLGSDTTICAGDSLSFDVSQPLASYLWSSGSTSAQEVAYPVDTVWATLTHVCAVLSDTMLLDTVSAFTVDLGADTLLCPADSISLSAPISGVNYLWSTGDTTDTIWIHQSGTYTMTASNACYSFSDTIVVDSLPVPTVQLGNDTVLCEGDTIDILTNTNQVSFLWQDSSTVSDYQVLTPDTFWVTVSNLCGPMTDTIVIDSLIPALVIFPADSILCMGDTVVLDATIQLGSYTWQDASTDSIFTATQTGMYWAEAVNSCGISSDTIFLEFLDVPVFDLGNDTVLCAGDSLQLVASSYLSTYSWDNASTDSVRWIYQSGTYSLTVSNQCFSASDTINIQGIEIPNFSLGPDTFLCEGYSMSLFASGYQASYLWHTGSTDSSILFSQGGQKWAEATNVCGSWSDTVFIQEILYPMVALPSDTALCENDSLLLNATFAGAWYLWNNSSTDSVLLVQDSGFYKVQVTNECGTVTDSISMGIEDSLLFSLGVDTLLCQGDSLLLSTYLSNDYPHFWQDTTGLNSFLVLVSGNYWVFVKNACGEAADTIVVTFTTAPSIELGGTQLLCNGDSTAFIGTYPFSTYSWNTTDTTDTLWAYSTGTYAVTTTNQCGFDSDSVAVSFDDTLQVELGPAVWGCVGTSETLSAQVNGEGEYQWSTGFVTEQIQVDAEDDYWLDVTNICGTVRDSVRVSYREVPEVTVSADTQICAGDEVVLSGISNNDTLQWNTGVSEPELTVSTQGLYWLQSTNYCGSARDSVRVGVQARPEIVLPVSLQICPGEQRLLQPFPPTLDYYWQDGSNQPDILVDGEGEYSVIGYSDLGCADTASVLVRICPSLWVPSAFTPDGDGLNDVFKVEGESLDEFELQVYNRWGQLVFSTRNPQEGWNGLYQGQRSVQGVYSWKVFFINRDREEEIRAGSVTLIR